MGGCFFDVQAAIDQFFSIIDSSSEDSKMREREFRAAKNYSIDYFRGGGEGLYEGCVTALIFMVRN